MQRTAFIAHVRGRTYRWVAVVAALTGPGLAPVPASPAYATVTDELVPVSNARSSSPAGTGRHPGAPPARAVIDYQLSWGYKPAAGIGGVVRDVSDKPAPGLWSGCYVNGFQTQPGDRTMWLTRHPELVLRDRSGKVVTDPGWPDEMLLDTRTATKRAAIAKVVGASIRTCAKKGFDAVELDNLNSWTRSKGRLTAAGAVDLAARYVTIGHRAGLAVAQKNGSELGTRGRDTAGFDFAIAEECVRYDECRAYTSVYGTAVLDVEYDRRRWPAVCSDRQRPSSTVLRDNALRTPRQAGYVFAACPSKVTTGR